MEHSAKIFVAGHRGVVGSAIGRRLLAGGFDNVVTRSRDDLADACVHLMARGYDGPLVNIGTGEDVTIRELPETVMQVAGFNGRIVFDSSKPDGTPRKLLDVSRLAALGWRTRTGLREGIARAYADFAGKESRVG